MKKTQFAGSQIINALKEHEGDRKSENIYTLSLLLGNVIVNLL